VSDPQKTGEQLLEELLAECMAHFGCSRREALSRVAEAAEEAQWQRWLVNARAFGALGANWLENTR
jgi:hypothetical protein